VPKKVLIVEDNELNLEVLTGVMLAYDVDVETRMDGTSGLEAVKSIKPHLLILDLQLPELDGETILRAIRSDDELKSIIVLVVTAKAMPEEKERVLDLGADKYLAKPFEINDIRRELDGYLERRPEPAWESDLIDLL